MSDKPAMLHGREVKPDDIIEWKNQGTWTVVRASSDDRHANGTRPQFPHLMYIQKYPQYARNCYRWPELREIVKYLAETRHGKATH